MASPTTALSTALALTTTAFTAAALYATHLHRTFRAQIRCQTLDTSTDPSCPDTEAQLPADPAAYRFTHTLDTIPLHLSNKEIDAQLFTRLMRRNMHHFATYAPQAYLLRLALGTSTFRTSHLEALTFEPGDLVCGVYRVLGRTARRCEMGMDGPELGGRLVVSVGEGELRTETLQWVRRDDGGQVMPMERRALRWLHEVVSWGLLVSGAKWLGEEVGREGKGEVM